jgi:hypothetical protein
MTILLVTPSLGDEAYNGLCQQQKHFAVSIDVWVVGFDWKDVKTTLIGDLNARSL